MFRWFFRIDACVMIAVGLLLLGWHDLFAPSPSGALPGTTIVTADILPAELERLVDSAIPVMIYRPNEEAVLLGGLFAGALIALGIASLAIGSSSDRTYQRKLAYYFLIGHVFLGFTVWELMAIWSTFAGFIILDLLIWPVPVLLYGLLPYRSAVASGTGALSSTEQEIREAAGQEERNRLAQDLHDSVKQQIYAVQTNLATVDARWDHDASGARTAIEHARRAARDAMVEMSALLDRLRRDPIESVGLVEALRRQCEAVGFQTGAKVSTTFGDLPEDSCLPSSAMTSVFRIAQEALANIARHARAKHVALQLATSKERNALFLEIRDDGCGFDTQSSSAGMGLRNMRFRAEQIGAELEMQSEDGEGSVMRLWLPLVDVKQERVKQHKLRLLAASIPAIAAAALMILWEGSAIFLLPFVAVGGAFTAFHLFALRRLKSA
jgi:signal transduction histidine kinase